MSSNSELVKEFVTKSASPNDMSPCADKPKPMNLDETKWIVKHCISELIELLQVTTSSNDEALGALMDCIRITDIKKDYKFRTKEELNNPTPSENITLMAEQYDAFADIEYYMKYWACKTGGVNIDKIFTEVHSANMRKMWSDGLFHHRQSDGKVIKPEEWKEPDIESVIKDQMTNGAWKQKIRI